MSLWCSMVALMASTHQVRVQIPPDSQDGDMDDGAGVEETSLVNPRIELLLTCTA